MPVTDGGMQAQRLVALQGLLLSSPGRKWRTREIADLFGVSPDTATRYLTTLSGTGMVPLISSGGTSAFVWELDPNARLTLAPLRLDYAQGTALYAAARLLSQQHDERNEAVRSALIALIETMPERLRAHLEAMVSGLTPSEAEGRDLTEIFTTLSRGWLESRVVRLTYEPLRSGRVYTCDFQPYLLEPSGIGYTIYFIGQSDPPGALRVYKLERVRHVALTDETFTVPDDFDGPALLRRAWRVMFGEGELIHVKLRFSQFVARRVRETRWHPSQTLAETPDGLAWEADIGDITEIRPWVRGWGADCEALEPPELREELQQEARKLARLYGVEQRASGKAGPDQTLLDDLFGKD